MQLWGRAAGRCQFKGHNEPLYKNPITQEPINLGELAHIYSFSEKGPRGWGLLSKNKKALNQIENLMLLCPACHKTVDNEKGKKYPVELLQKWKREHEERIWITSGIDPKNKSYPVFYFSRIGKFVPKVDKDEAIRAMFPARYPAQENAIDLSSKPGTEDSQEAHWKAEEENLKKHFNRKILPIIEDEPNAHFSIFALAPMPLLIKLGILFSDINQCDIFQPIREPGGWQFEEAPDDFEFIINRPKSRSGRPILALSLSTQLRHERVTSVLGENVDIWEISVPSQFQHNDFIRSRQQLRLFREAYRKVIAELEEVYETRELHVFPIMPASCAISLGICRQQKAAWTWIIYDHNNQIGGFTKTLTLEGN